MDFPNSIYGFPNLHIYGLIEKYPQIASDWMEENESNLVEIESEERQQHNFLGWHLTSILVTIYLFHI